MRSGDVVLMWIDPETRAALRQENLDKAKDQAEAVERTHYEETKNIRAPGMAQEHEVKPRGRSMIEEREHEFDYTQRDSTQEG